MKRLPIGISSFEEIRTGGYYYVDKTRFVEKLVEEGKYYFLSRPRRFGKSLFVDTIKCAFEGRKELFEGLYLHNKWEWERKYPVIRIGFEKDTKGKEKVRRYIRRNIIKNADKYGIRIKEEEEGLMMVDLVEMLWDKYREKVVVLIDEYDKPILDNIEDKEEAERVREVLKELYSVLKGIDRYLKFVFITGISKFAKVSLFSGLNQLNDISISREYGDICGYTEEEVMETFGQLIRDEQEMEKIREWYNGYWWLGSKVYNPFDVLLYLENRVYRSYWFKTGNPEFLVKVMREKGYYMPNMEGVVVDDNSLDVFDIEEIRVEALLYQTGYLTIKEVMEEEDIVEYRLGYPNKEVRIALSSFIANSISERMSEWSRRIRRIFKEGEIEELRGLLVEIMGSVPYNWYREAGKYEGFYSAMFYMLLISSKLNVIAEDVTSVGRIDMTVIEKGRVYVVEFKVDKEEALERIKKKRYYEKYEGFEEIYLIGIVVDSKERKVKKIEVEKHK